MNAGTYVYEEAIFEGVENYGSANISRETMESFRYRFLINGEEFIFKIDPGKKDAVGNYDYPIQNCLKEKYSYEITVKDGTVFSARELPAPGEYVFKPVVNGTPGVRTLGNFLKTAMEPVGTTLYIYGGGWNWQDTGSSLQSRTIRVSPDWVRFFREQDENFTYKSKDGDERNADPIASYYPYGRFNQYYYAGLDCSGYLGWVLYNTFETQNGRAGYVSGSRSFAKMLSEKGFGDWTREIAVPSDGNNCAMKPGDIVSVGRHVLISLGTCSDGSIVILHSTPANSRTGQPGGGVELSAIGLSEECEAYRLADHYMSLYYPDWYERYPVMLADPETFFTFSDDREGKFTWNTGGDVLSDPENVSSMTPSEVLTYLFTP